MTLSIMALDTECFYFNSGSMSFMLSVTNKALSWVPSCWMSLCWVPSWWLILCWMSFCWMYDCQITCVESFIKLAASRKNLNVIIFQRFGWNRQIDSDVKFHQNFTKNFTKISPKFHQNFTKISPKFRQNFT